MGAFINKTHGKLRTLHVCSSLISNSDWNGGELQIETEDNKCVYNFLRGSRPNRYKKLHWWMFCFPKGMKILAIPWYNLVLSHTCWRMLEIDPNCSRLYSIFFFLYSIFFLLNVWHFYLTIMACHSQEMAGRPMRDSEVTPRHSTKCFDLVYVHIVAILLRQPITSRLGEMGGGLLK